MIVIKRCWLLYILVYFVIHCHRIVKSLGCPLPCWLLYTLVYFVMTLSYDCKESGCSLPCWLLYTLVYFVIHCHRIVKSPGCSLPCWLLYTLVYFVMILSYDCTVWDISSINNKECELMRTFNIFQISQKFTIYRRYFLLKFEQFSWICYTTLFKIRRNQRLLQAGKSTWYRSLLKGMNDIFCFLGL